MARDIREVKNITDLIGYFSTKLGWNIDIDDFEDIEDISYDFDAVDIGLKEESFAKISSLRQLQPLVDGQQWGIFCVEFDSNRFEPSALKKILSGLIPRKRNSADHAVWCQQDLLFICNWGTDNNSTIGLAHFEDREGGLPQIKMFSCAPALEDFTQIKLFEERLAQLAWPKNTSNIDEWREVWSSAFTLTYKQTIQDSSTLTVQLAAEAQNIRNRILDILEVETQNGYVHLLYEKFRDTLIQDMSEQQFADMYAQTVVYGLFSARCLDQTQDDFSAAEAIELIPNTNPFLKSLMKECFGAESKSKLSFDELEIGNVVDLLKNTKTDAIIQDFNRQTGGGREDPVIHFYEEFLTAYDKAQKVQRGVYYTPQPVVNFIVRAVDSILKTEFGYEDGLASEETKKLKITRTSQRRVDGFYKEVEDVIDVPAVQILDPATGTGTFLRQTILQIYDNFCTKHKGKTKEEVAKLWNEYVDRSLLPRVNGFELMMAPYAVAHMKLAMILKDTGYDFSGRNRLNVYLTNSLEKAGNSEMQMSLWDDPLATESIEANSKKKSNGINIIIGNPPYSGESANQGEWISGLMDDYKTEPGGKVKLQERNYKWLNDDYVKFIRYSQYWAEKNEQSIVAYICPHGFLDNPTFRGMRWQLLSSFSQLYILNLHGNTKRKEVCPDGTKDENVFDIMQGVCIVICVKTSGKLKKLADVLIADLYGIRQMKYDYLNTVSWKEVNYKKIDVVDPYFYFVNRDYGLKAEFEQGFGLDELFVLNGVGITTAHDEFVISANRKELLDRFKKFQDSNCDVELYKKFNVKEKKGWDITEGWKNIQGETDLNKYVHPIAYRPFDVRYIFYEDKLVWRTARKTMMHMIEGENVALVTVNRQPEKMPVGYYFVTENILSNGYIRSDSVSIDTLMPLYTYSRILNKIYRKLNFNEKIIKQIEESLGLSFSENDEGIEQSFTAINLFDYVYAILYHNVYRKKYEEYLKTEFARIPYPTDKDVFKELVHYGEQLRTVHLMNGELSCDKKLGGVGNGIVEKSPAAAFKDNKVYINKMQFFDGIDLKTWNMYIGGYQPLQKWLKDRKGMVISEADVTHFYKIVTSLEITSNIMDEIEKIKIF